MKLSLILLFFAPVLVFSQNHEIGVGFQLGINSTYGDGSIYLSYLYKRSAELNIGYGNTAYHSACAASEVTYTLFYKEEVIRPTFGVAYNYSPNCRVNLALDDDHIGSYLIPRQSFIIPSFGLRKDYFKEGENGYISLRVFANYRFQKMGEKVEHIKGYKSEKIINGLQQDINALWGGGIRVILVFNGSR